MQVYVCAYVCLTLRNENILPNNLSEFYTAGI